MPRRRSHNRYREVFDQELAGRPLLANGLPCGRCGFPMLEQPVSGQGGRWSHADCTESPKYDAVAAHLVVQWARETGSADLVWRAIANALRAA